MREITGLEELKTIELDIMKAVHSFCEENNIVYFLAHGTLLGTIRHKGFIPWDDDIDVFMPREEYKRFHEILQDRDWKINDRYTLVNHKTPIYFGRPMSKVIDTHTVLTEKEYLGDDPIGVFVDIWPLDGMTSNKDEQIQQLAFVKTKKQKLYLSISKMKALENIKGKIKHLLVQFCSKKKLVDDVEQAAMKYCYSDSDYVVCYMDPYSVVLKKQWFEKRELADFENEKFYIPSGYHEVLTQLYGDYMKLPPVEKQVPHHIIDTFWK